MFELFLQNSPFDLGGSPLEYDKQVGIRHKKNFESYSIKECYKTKYIFNEYGLPRSINNYNSVKKDVILLGASNIEAIMVENQNIVHNSLAKEFNGKYNFLNYGISGVGPTQEFVILKEKINLENAEYVVQFIDLEGDLLDVVSKNRSPLARPLVYIEFDSLDEYRVISPRAKTLYDSTGDLLSKYQIYIFIKKLLYSIKDNVLAIKNNSTKQPIIKQVDNNLDKNWLYLKGGIYQTNKHIKSINENIKYKIIVNSDNESNKIVLKRFLDAEGIEYMYLDNVAKDMNIELKSFECDHHWTDEAHKNIARIIKETSFIN